MIWFFERERDRLRYEIRHHVAGTDFELVVTYPDGRQRVERAADPRELLVRTGLLRSALVRDGWRAIGVR